MFRYWPIRLFVCFVLVAFSNAAVASSPTGNLTLEVDGLRNQKGLLCLKLFSSSRGFPNRNEGVVKRQCTRISAEPFTVTFSNLKAGSYAVAVFHDANGDRTLNRNALGMPTEGYGFSNNPVVRAAPPKYGDAVFLIAGPSTYVKIQVRY